MIEDKRVVVVLPAYNAAKTLKQTVAEVPFDIVDDLILVDDHSKDDTITVAKELGIKHVLRHNRNMGYGANQKTCYMKALSLNADIVVMLHPDYQYTPKLIRAMCYILADTDYDVVLGSRILGLGALKGGMPLHKYIANRILTFLENILIGQKLSEFHTGYRAFSRKFLETIDFINNSDDFIFDNEVLVQGHYHGFQICEVTCPTSYHDDASSINLLRSAKYGLLCCLTGLKYRLHRLGIRRFALFLPNDQSMSTLIGQHLQKHAQHIEA
jgi:glycosyltransferase involved in cell wall biosynthesis